MTKILVLGGTAEAVELTRNLIQEPGVRVTYSLAGRTRKPVLPDCTIHTGGFGGVEGLMAFLGESHIDAIVDATHPFAEQIASNARAAAATTGIPLFKFLRPAWEEPPNAPPGARWFHVANPTEASRLIDGRFRRIFLSVGLGDIAAFAHLSDVWFLVRSVEVSDVPATLAHHHHITSRGPFDLVSEIALLKEWQIEVLVSKNSGGAATAAKLDAARQLGIPVIMIDRPPIPQSEIYGTVSNLIEGIRQHLHPGRPVKN